VVAEGSFQIMSLLLLRLLLLSVWSVCSAVHHMRQQI
jgi:cell division protein FtsL